MLRLQLSSSIFCSFLPARAKALVDCAAWTLESGTGIGQQIMLEELVKNLHLHYSKNIYDVDVEVSSTALPGLSKELFQRVL